MDFLKDLKPTALSALSADQVTDFLQRMSARADLAEWQMRQIVDAVRLLLVDLAQVPAGKGVDWDYWWEGQRTLPPEHATIARSTAMSAEDGAGPRAIGVPRFSRSARTFPILEDLARTIRAMQYSIRTEQSYVDWCHRFLMFCGSKPLDALGVPDVQRFLSHLAVERSVSAKTQSLAYNAVAFRFKHLLERPLEDVKFSKTRRQARLPVVLSRDEMRALLAHMDGTFGLMARLMYGTGMRLMECVRLRVLDVDFDNGLVAARGQGRGSGDADREARELPCLEALVRNPPSGSRVRHPHGAGAARTCGRVDDHDLHPCTESAGGAAREEPGGRDLEAARSASSWIHGCNHEPQPAGTDPSVPRPTDSVRTVPLGRKPQRRPQARRVSTATFPDGFFLLNRQLV
ncbi:phage integrase N-terminal SAM-like domain-containing protein [Thiocapsa roseopersicina]|uniref:Phage integrase family protein n=1 Tax=Thiocapsa roseopersicina TaxID=1058 RepID=A0A1H3DZN5_THIRO|nr:Phage integrase family protein [Thiocapsa roseopersicina]